MLFIILIILYTSVALATLVLKEVYYVGYFISF